MRKFAFCFLLWLCAGTAAAFQLHHHHHHFPQLSVPYYRKRTTARLPKCTFNHFVLADNNRVEVENGKSWESDLLLNGTTGAPSSPELVPVPSTCSSSNNDMGQKFDSNMALDQSVKVLWSILFFLLIDPLCAFAESATEFYSEKYNFWQVLALSPGFSMVLLVFGVLSFGYGSLKSDLKADITELKAETKAEVNSVKAEVNSVKADIGKLDNKIDILIGSVNARLDILIGSINGRLDNQDQKVENAVKELGLQKREIEMSKKQ
jgi:hypothetical protein